MRRVMCILLVLVMGCPAHAVQWLKQSTAKTVKIGPFVDSTDGVTPETALTIGQADIRLSKNGGDFAQTNNATGATHDENGWFDVPLDTTDTGTLGSLDLAVYESGALPVLCRYMVVPANVWDSMFGADNLQVDRIQVGGTANASVTIANAYGGSTFQSVDDVYDEDLSGHSTAGTAGKALTDIGTKTGYLPSATAGAAGGLFIAGSNAATSVTTALTANITGNLSGSVGSVTGAVASVTGNVGGSVASVTSGVTLANDAITAAKFDESTAFPLKSADTGSTAVARTGSDSDTLETLSDQVDGVGSSADPWATTASGYLEGTFGYIVMNTEDSAGVAKIVRMELEKAPDADPNAGSIMATNVKIETMLQSDGATGYEWTAQAQSNVSATVEGEVTVAAASVTAIQSGLATAALVGDVNDVLRADIADIDAGSGLTAQQTRDAMKLAPSAGAADAGSIDALVTTAASDSTAAKTAAEKIDTNTELRTLLTGSDTAVSTYDPATDTVILANGAHGGAAATITAKQIAVTNSDAGGIAVNIQGTGTGNSHAINLASINGKAIAAASTNSDAISVDSDAARGIVVVGATGDIVSDITGQVSGTASLLPTNFSTVTVADGKIASDATVSLTEGDQTAIAAAIAAALNASGVTLTADAVDAILDELVTGHDTPSSLGWYIKKIKASLWK